MFGFGAQKGDGTMVQMTTATTLWRKTISSTGTLVGITAVLAVVGCGSASPHISNEVVTIGSGRTFAGTRFVATLLGGGAREAPSRSAISGEVEPTSTCPLNVAIREESYRSSIVECYARMASPVRPVIECVRGLLVIHMQATNAANRVQLTLGNGQTVTSYLMNVSRWLGGPAKLYYQAIRGSSSSPVAVTELSENGRVLRTTKVVSAVTHCEK
jgi:hypothetical protein